MPIATLTFCCPRPLSHFFILAAEHAFKGRHVKTSSKNTSSSISSGGGRIITQIGCHRCSLLHTGLQVLLIPHQKIYGLKHKIGLSLHTSPILLSLISFILHFLSTCYTNLKSCLLSDTDTACLLMTLCSIAIGRLMALLTMLLFNCLKKKPLLWVTCNMFELDRAS